MAILKCKMCGGNLMLIEGASTVECEYCGSMQTIPKVDDEKKLTLFSRANRLRASGDFDKAAGIYEAIVADFPEEAEAYWGLVLCQYGIEYVDDSTSSSKIPTCHRSSFDSVMKKPKRGAGTGICRCFSTAHLPGGSEADRGTAKKYHCSFCK